MYVVCVFVCFEIEEKRKDERERREEKERGEDSSASALLYLL